jgi:hypothetical protein
MHQRLFLIHIFLGFTLLAHNQSRNLDYYLKEGQHNSPLLNEYRNLINSAGADSLLISAGKKPQVEARSQLLYSPFYDHFGYDEVITDGGNYTAVIGVSWNILNKKEISNKYETVSILKQTLNNTSKVSLVELNKIISGQYLTAFAGYRDILFNTSFLELLRDENEIVIEFVKNGVVKKTDYLSLLIETQSQEILVNQLKSQYRQDLMLLNQLCGLVDTAWYELTDPQLVIKGTSDVTRNPSYVQYKIDSIRIENEKSAIDIRYKPKVNLFADAGFLTSNPWNFYQHFGYSAGVGLTIPLYDGKQRDIEKQKLAFDENSRMAYQNNFRNKYYQQILQLENYFKALNENSVRIENQLKTADQLVKELKDQLEAGIIQMTEYINAIKNFKSISRNLIMINIQKLQVINEMNFLLTQ